MANLIVRNVDEKLIKALKARAGRRGVSAEAEHREILAQALLKSRKRSFAEVIAAMPNVCYCRASVVLQSDVRQARHRRHRARDDAAAGARVRAACRQGARPPPGRRH